MSGERTAEGLKISALAMLDRKLDLTIRNCKAVVERVIELERTVNNFTGSALGPASASDGEGESDAKALAAERSPSPQGEWEGSNQQGEPTLNPAPNPSEGGEIETVGWIDERGLVTRRQYPNDEPLVRRSDHEARVRALQNQVREANLLRAKLSARSGAGVSEEAARTLWERMSGWCEHARAGGPFSLPEKDDARMILNEIAPYMAPAPISEERFEKAWRVGYEAVPEFRGLKEFSRTGLRAFLTELGITITPPTKEEGA